MSITSAKAAASFSDKKRLYLDFFRYLEAKKKKNKKPKTEDHLDFPGRETIKFGEVVEAPPKLSVPKVAISVVLVYIQRILPLSIQLKIFPIAGFQDQCFKREVTFAGSRGLQESQRMVV